MKEKARTEGRLRNGTPQSRTYAVNDIAAILRSGHAPACNPANSGAFKTIRIGNMIRSFRNGKAFGDWVRMGK